MTKPTASPLIGSKRISGFVLHTLNAENPSRAIAYVRVSSQRQVDEGVSIEVQIKKIREYARFKGMEIDDKDIIIEEGVSLIFLTQEMSKNIVHL